MYQDVSRCIKMYQDVSSQKKDATNRLANEVVDQITLAPTMFKANKWR